MEPLSPRTSHAAAYLSFPKQAEFSAETFCEILDSHQLTPDSVPQIIFEVRLFYFLVPCWDHCWGRLGLSSHLWDGWASLWDPCVLQSRMVWPLLKSNSLDTAIIYPYK